MKYIYVSGPLSGDRIRNTHAAILVANELMRRGYWPFLPHLSVLWDAVTPKPYEDWMALDLAWVAKCDAVYRISGVSPGADREVALAKELGLPIYYSIGDL